MPKAELTDGQLIEKVREGDRELYGEIIRRYQTKLAHYLRKFISHDAEKERIAIFLWMKEILKFWIKKWTLLPGWIWQLKKRW